MRASSRLFVFLFTTALLAVSLAACTPGTVIDDGGGENSEEEEVDLSDYEDFDPAPYREEAPAAREAVEHDVPARLLSGRADEGVEQTMQGYRVQVLSSKDKDAAEGAATQAEQWWNANAGDAPSGLFGNAETFPVYTIYRQPYYRVRVGNFAERAEAERALEFLQRRYTDAFIVRGEVTVTR